MPGLAMDQASARPSRSAHRPKYDGVATAVAQSVVKEEDVYEDDDTYRPRPQLPKPTVLMRDLATLMKFMEAGIIDVDPEYQREVVWTADRMTGLVDSLMENYYIPPIILNKKPRSGQAATTHPETLVCVDGKQRLSTVLAFVKGMIPCHDHRGEKWWFCEPAGTKRKRVLSELLQKQFFKKEFVSFEFTNLSPEQEEDLFARVQMGVQLNMAEKMRASTGPWQELARLFVEDFPVVYSLMKDRARSKDFQLTLACFSQIVECMHPTNANGVPMLKTNHTYLPKLLSNKSAVDDGLKSHLASVWNTFKDLIEADPDTFTNGNKYLRGVQTFAPVEMVAVVVLISTHSETRNNRLLLGDIQAMRTAVREHFIDLRLNATLWKWFWEYIEELEGIRGAIDGSTVNRKTKQRAEKTATTSTTGFAAGSTAAAITAAAAAPKKGRATARTKRPAVPTTESTPVTIKQEPGTAVPSDTRLLKRRRTGDSPLDETVTNGAQSEIRAPSTTADEAQVPTGLPMEWTRAESLLPPIPTHASTQSPQPVARKPHQRSKPAPSAPPSTASNPINDTLSRASRTPLATPSEARQQRVSELNSYRTPYQSAPSFAQSPVLDGITRRHPRVPTAPMLASPGAYEVPTRAGFFSVDRDQSQGGGIVEATTPETSTVPQVPNSRPRSTRPALESPPRPTQEQYSGAIDLTSDTEQERKSLLSAFKTKPANTEPPKETAKTSTTTPAAQKRASTSKEKNTATHEALATANNPYASLKNT